MIFQRTYRYNTPLSVEDIKKKLLGKHIQVHHLDFEILEKDQTLKIIPHAEDANGIKTLPVTNVELYRTDNGGTKVIINTRPRRIDVGGLYLIIAFTIFIALLGFSALIWDKKWLGIGILIASALLLIIFYLRMATGYFDYTRKIRNFIRHNGA